MRVAVASRSFTVEHNGRTLSVRPGMVVRVDHPMVVSHPDAFRLEERDAAPETTMLRPGTGEVVR